MISLPHSKLMQLMRSRNCVDGDVLPCVDGGDVVDDHPLAHAVVEKSGDGDPLLSSCEATLICYSCFWTM